MSASRFEGTTKGNTRGTGPAGHPSTSHTAHKMDQLDGNSAQEGWEVTNTP